MKLLSPIFIIYCSFLIAGFSPAQSIGNGRDGAQNIDGIVNTYTSLTADANQCDNIVNVNDGSSLSAGDLILIMQMQGTEFVTNNDSSYGKMLDYKNCGNYEYAQVRDVRGNQIQLQFTLMHNYSIKGQTQIVRVPQYTNAIVAGELTCEAWNGSTGGVLAIDVIGTLHLEDILNVSGKGFRGGRVEKGNHVMFLKHDYVAEPDPTLYSYKGEGVGGYGIGNMISGRGAVVNGGGGGNIHTTGGGGGSNATRGGDGGWGYPVDTTGGEKFVYGIGGHSLSYAGNKIFMGGGGGAGHEHFGNGSSGGNGSGIIFLTCNNLNGNSKYILASGDGSASSGGYGDGAGGAGAGGTICLSVSNYISPISIIAIGGNGGSTILKGFGPGGGGSGGVIYLSKTEQPLQLSTLLRGGTAGSAGGLSYGAANGSDGVTLFKWQPPLSNTLIEECFTETENIFTPNGDALNDVFFKLNNIEGLLRVQLQIFNRWGKEVYSSDDNNGWDGKDISGNDLAEGTYYYKATLSSDFASLNRSKRGYIILQR